MILTIELRIHESAIEAIRLPEDDMRGQLLVELAVALYAGGMLSFGKARELTGLSHYEFARVLGKRSVVRHYGQSEKDVEAILNQLQGRGEQLTAKLLRSRRTDRGFS